MSILDHVVYAYQQKKASVEIPATKLPAAAPVPKVAPPLPKRGEHDRFKKLPGERDQLKALKKQVKQSTTQKTYNAFDKIEALTT